MILHTLVDYYQRLSDDPNVNIAHPGFEHKPIDFLLVLKADGSFENLRDIREGSGRNRKGRISLVPKGVKRTAGVNPNLLWDTSPYVLGKVLRCDKMKKLRYTKAGGEKKLLISASTKELKKLTTRSSEQHEAFVKKIIKTFEGCEDVGLQAILTFLEQDEFNFLFGHTVWSDIEENGGNISFALSGEVRFVCQRPEVVSAIFENAKPEGRVQTCSVSGIEDVPAKLHTSIKGVWGAQTAGANIVSFNLDAFRSFGKKQGYNAPIGQRSEFAYTTALNHLLASKKQRMQVGDASTVFWAKKPCDFETDFHSFLAPPKGEEAVSYEKIKGLISAVRTGITPAEADLPFFVLGLAPNASRISIRFWYDGNVKEIKERIAQHFQDLEMVRAPYDPEYLSMKRLILSTTRHSSKYPYGDSDDIVPHLAGEIFDAVIKGFPYPQTLLQKIVNRIKAEQALCDSKGKRLENVSFARAALLKGFLVRNARISQSNQKEVSMGLDKTYDNTGYVLGRLFAVLERIQEQAQGTSLNKTIRDTYFGSAASSPLTTFKRLSDLSIHHLAKIRNSGKSTVWLDRLLGEVNGLLPKEGYPSILKIEDQGRFSVGYYHQRQDFFKKHEIENKGEK